MKRFVYTLYFLVMTLNESTFGFVYWGNGFDLLTRWSWAQAKTKLKFDGPTKLTPKLTPKVKA